MIPDQGLYPWTPLGNSVPGATGFPTACDQLCLNPDQTSILVLVRSSASVAIRTANSVYKDIIQGY